MIEYMDREDAEVLHTAAVVGIPELANERERMEIVEPEESLEAAKALRPVLLVVGPKLLERFPYYVDRLEKELKRRKQQREDS